MTGLDEVDAFLAGKRAGYKVTLPAEVIAKNPTVVISALHPVARQTPHRIKS